MHQVIDVCGGGLGHANDPSGVTQLGFDEASRRQGHTYLTVAVDLEESRVLHVVEGKDSNTSKEIGDYLTLRGVAGNHLTQASIDLSPAFVSGIGKHFPEAAITFDRLYVVTLLNEAMDTVRKQERRGHAALKGHTYTFLRNPKTETHSTNAILESINNNIQMAKRRARGYRNTDNSINIIYFLCGKLTFNYPLYSS